MHKNFWGRAPDPAAITCSPVTSLTIFLELLTGLLRATSHLLVLCVGAEVRVPCHLAKDGNQSRAAFEGTVHLVGVEVGLEALVMSFFYREVLSAVLVVVSILQSVFGMHE